jgi:hypothetical protein
MEGGENVLCSKNGTRPSSSAAEAVASRAPICVGKSLANGDRGALMVNAANEKGRIHFPVSLIKVFASCDA